jgi:FkbM family methyltransferase
MGTVQRTLAPTLRAYRFVNRPYYWYRPRQILSRLRVRGSPADGPSLQRTAWGSQLYCWPDPLGNSVARTGVYDLIVSEALARLADPGETCIDAGANVGLMSNLLSQTVGSAGRVVCFEPHPLIAATLRRNVALWKEIHGMTNIDVHEAAISSSRGRLPLAVDPQAFAHNKGTATLEQADSANSTEVTTVSLDDVFSGSVGVLKLDVEGHELQALRGAARLLGGGSIRDVLFEEHRRPPTPVIELLREHSYTVLSLRQGLTGPLLSAPADAYDRQLWDPPAMLATIDPARARSRLKRRGWVCLRRRDFH